MYYMYIDDERNPVGKFDIVCRDSKSAMRAFKRKYNEGERHFYLEIDHDSGDIKEPFINVLKDIETYVHLGKMKNLNISIHQHSGNVVGRQNISDIIKANDFMTEVY